MEKANIVVLKLNGLNCAVCAGKIESKIKTMDNITSVKLNFLTNELEVSHSEKSEKNLINKIQKAIDSIENGISVSALEQNKNIFIDKIFIAGLIIYIIGFFVKNPTLNLAINLVAYVIIGYNVIKIAILNCLRKDFFDENFLMMIATIGAFAVGSHEEAVAVMIFYKIGEILQSYAVDKSKKSIKSLLKLKPEKANLVQGDITRIVTPEELVLNNIIMIKPGEKVPIDGIIINGFTFVDSSAITGESTPVKLGENDNVLSGSVNINSVILVQVTKIYKDSTVSKIIDMVNEAYEKKGKTEKFITKFAKIYTPVVVLIAFLTATIVPFVLGQSYSEWFYKACVFLVISCPCALVVSVPLTFFSAVGTAAREGILFKGSEFIEKLANITTIAFDKTGTLTKGVFTITSETILDEKFVPILLTLEKNSNHPISKAILEHYNKISDEESKDAEEIGGKGIFGKINGKIALAGNEKLMDQFDIKYEKFNQHGTVVYVAFDNRYLGCIGLSDIIKEDSFLTIKNLNKMGIKTVMLTGDNEKTALAVKEKLKLDEVYYNLLPQGKVEIIKKLYEDSHQIIAFAGDGINDAPALVNSDVGIAMGEKGSDIAIESADLVINNDNPLKIISAINISKNTIKIAKINIIFAIGIKLLVLILSVMGYADMWLAVFADVGVTLLAVMNSMRNKL